MKVAQSGEIYLNGGSVTLEELRSRLEEVKEQKGVVWYYRENPAGEPPKAALEAIKIITELKLPVKLLDRDFDNP